MEEKNRSRIDDERERGEKRANEAFHRYRRPSVGVDLSKDIQYLPKDQ